MKQDLKTITILFRATRTLEDIIKREVESYGISLSEFMVMEALFHKGTLSVNEVLSKILIPNSSMSYVIDQLLTKGLIEKNRDFDDHRIYRLNLTEAGTRFMKKIYPRHQRALRLILDKLSLDEEMLLQESLKKIGKR
jgi:MarR family 2-MHQ and catechol resistance regulon transcriptional repressor